MHKMMYIRPEAELVVFENEDVITTSCTGDQGCMQCEKKQGSMQPCPCGTHEGYMNPSTGQYEHSECGMLSIIFGNISPWSSNGQYSIDEEPFTSILNEDWELDDWSSSGE